MSWLRTYIAACAVVTALVLVALVLLVSFVDLGLSGHGIAAMLLGALLTIAIAMVLMGLVFSSARSGRDERVRGVGTGKAARGEPELRSHSAQASSLTVGTARRTGSFVP